MAVEAKCTGCGCTDAEACPDGCEWVYLDPQTGRGWCSSCQDEEGDGYLTIPVRESNAIEGVANEGLWLRNHFRAASLCRVAAAEEQLLHPRVLHALVFEGLAPHLSVRQQDLSWLHYNPGEYRRHAVQVGRDIPPPAEHVPLLMVRWDAEALAMEPWDAHAWFEAIHPFPDGNGRVGRLLWWNLLMLAGRPIEVIYAEHRHAYYDRLDAWRRENPQYADETIEVERFPPEEPK